MTGPKERTRRTITLLISELGPWQLAFGADAVEVISAEVGQPPDEEPPHDLARHLGGPSLETSSARRTLSMRTGGGQVRIAVPERIWIETISLESLIPLPAFVAPGLRRLGVEALAACSAGLAFVMDVDLLARLMREGEAA